VTLQTHSQPLVTVVVPAYNAGEFLRPSVLSVLEQSYQNVEVLVIDDGSTDDSINTILDLADSRLRIIRQTNSGKPAVLNHAIDIMHGEYFVVQDADDLSYPSRIQEMVECMQAHPNLGMLFTGYDLIINDKHLAPTNSPLTVDECQRLIEQFKMPGHDPTSITRADVAKEFGYSPELRIAEGLDFILRVGEKYPIMRLGRCLYSYRISFSSLTRGNVERRKTYVRDVVRKAYRRRGLPIPPSLDESQDQAAASAISVQDYDNNIAAQFMESAIDLRRDGRLCKAVVTGLQCMRLHPLAFHYHKALIYSLLPIRCIQWIRSRKNG
jgi:glycosyltransferase involved in cell wall biosynthesis